MATTTNYGWTTPDDTALVKDGAAAIRTLGSSVDTTTKALNPSTTLGDIEYRSSTANTNTRLGIGTTGQVLSVSGGVPAWSTPTSGSLTLLSTTSLSGASTTISGISQDYTHLYLVLHGATYSLNPSNLRIAPNGTTNKVHFTGTADGSLSGYNASYARFYETIVNDHTSADNVLNLQIFNYASTTFFKPMFANNLYTTASGVRAECYQGGFATNTAVTSLVFSAATANLSTGTVLLYGVK